MNRVTRGPGRSNLSLSQYFLKKDCHAKIFLKVKVMFLPFIKIIFKFIKLIELN